MEVTPGTSIRRGAECSEREARQHLGCYLYSLAFFLVKILVDLEINAKSDVGLTADFEDALVRFRVTIRSRRD